MQFLELTDDAVQAALRKYEKLFATGDVDGIRKDLRTTCASTTVRIPRLRARTLCENCWSEDSRRCATTSFPRSSNLSAIRGLRRHG